MANPTNEQRGYGMAKCEDGKMRRIPEKAAALTGKVIWVYKITNQYGERVWIVRMPRWAGGLLDWNHKRKWGFIP